VNDAIYRGVSFWLDSVPEPLTPRPSLAGDVDADVAIVGAGFSGLWTAYYLKRLRPSLRIVVLEGEIAGYGASGRNGGWCVGLLAGVDGLLKRPDKREQGLALQRATVDAVDEIGRVTAAEGIDCHYRKGGSVRVAVNDGQLHLLREFWSVAGQAFAEGDVRWLEPAECEQYVRMRSPRGGFWFRHCAALHPARLARGLASCIEQLGVRLYERSPVTRLENGRAVTAHGSVRAGVVVRATEAYTARLEGHHRALLPMHSFMIATEPLPESTWKEIGLENAETFGDGRGITTYGQRTADGRIAFGGEGQYLFGSGIRRSFPATHEKMLALEKTLRDLVPAVRDARITHRWGGALGIPRDSRTRVGVDRASGRAWIGGYAGEGVCASNLAGRTLAELLAEVETERTELALVGPPSRDWEPEPMRWFAVGGVLRVVDAADESAETGKPPGWRERLVGALVPR